MAKARTPDVTTEQDRTSDYNQSSNQVGNSTDVTSQTGGRVSSGSTIGRSVQAGEQSEFVNVGCNVSFTVKIRGGFPTVPGNC